MNQWCFERRDELVELAGEKSPVLVYNEEILNESLFDLLSIEAVERIFQSIELESMPEVLRKFYEMGAGFRVRSDAEVRHLLSLFPALVPDRFLLVPEQENPETCKIGADLGVYTVLSNHALKALGKGCANRSVLLRVSVKQDNLVPQNMEPSFLSTLAGIYLEGRQSHAVSLKGIFDRLHETASILPKPFTVCLSHGLGLPMEREKDCIDTARFVEEVEEITEAYPGMRLWVEPGRHVVSHACVLLGRAKDPAFQVKARDCVAGGYHKFQNLTRPNEKGQEVHPGNDKKDLATVLSGARSDDILVVTNMGGCTLKQGDSQVRVREHYLKARRICRVKL